MKNSKKYILYLQSVLMVLTHDTCLSSSQYPHYITAVTLLAPAVTLSVAQYLRKTENRQTSLALCRSACKILCYFGIAYAGYRTFKHYQQYDAHRVIIQEHLPKKFEHEAIEAEKVQRQILREGYDGTLIRWLCQSGRKALIGPGREDILPTSTHDILDKKNMFKVIMAFFGKTSVDWQEHGLVFIERPISYHSIIPQPHTSEHYYVPLIVKIHHEHHRRGIQQKNNNNETGYIMLQEVIDTHRQYVKNDSSDSALPQAEVIIFKMHNNDIVYRIAAKLVTIPQFGILQYEQQQLHGQYYGHENQFHFEHTGDQLTYVGQNQSFPIRLQTFASTEYSVQQPQRIQTYIFSSQLASNIDRSHQFTIAA